MSTDAKVSVACSGCGASLPPDQAGRAADEPCHYCGETQKKIRIEIADRFGVEVHDSFRGRLKDPAFPSKKNPRVEVFSGADIRKSDGKWMSKERVIDKDNDLYKEVVTDPETGEVIHHNEEPLSEHFGHGSAKFKKED
jgi:hypothetical protein